MEKIMPIQSIPGALARNDGAIKLPETNGTMPNGGTRVYHTSWVYGTIRKASKTARHKYLGINHKGKNYKVHRLVCEAFHGKPASKNYVVIHINEIHTDNRPDNLKWGTQKENLNCAGFVEYCRSRTGDCSPRTKGAKKK